jgi:hypothetical protein
MSLDAQIAETILDGERRRHDRVTRVLAAMTDREQALVCEVAVMANVRATRHGTEIPRDSVVVYNTIAACLAMPDLYPALARIARIAERRAQRAREAS